MYNYFYNTQNFIKNTKNKIKSFSMFNSFNYNYIIIPTSIIFTYYIFKKYNKTLKNICKLISEIDFYSNAAFISHKNRYHKPKIIDNPKSFSISCKKT